MVLFQCNLMLRGRHAFLSSRDRESNVRKRALSSRLGARYGCKRTSLSPSVRCGDQSSGRETTKHRSCHMCVELCLRGFIIQGVVTYYLHVVTCSLPLVTCGAESGILAEWRRHLRALFD